MSKNQKKSPDADDSFDLNAERSETVPVVNPNPASNQKAEDSKIDILLDYIKRLEQKITDIERRPTASPTGAIAEGLAAMSEFGKIYGNFTKELARSFDAATERGIQIGKAQEKALRYKQDAEEAEEDFEELSEQLEKRLSQPPSAGFDLEKLEKLAETINARLKHN